MTYPATGWQLHAACATADPELFYPPDHEPPAARRQRERAAKAVCARCPVQAPCLDYAKAMQPAASFDHGVWGGLTPNDRHPDQSRRAPLLTEPEIRDAHTHARTESAVAAAAALGVTVRTLYRAWERYGLPLPTEEDRTPRPRRSPAWEHRDVAEAAWTLAEAEGLEEAARRTGISRDALLTAWAHWGMGRPDTRHAAARRKQEAARRSWQRRAVPA